jgi:hypothetical protein
MPFELVDEPQEPCTTRVVIDFTHWSEDDLRGTLKDYSGQYTVLYQRLKTVSRYMRVVEKELSRRVKTGK